VCGEWQGAGVAMTYQAIDEALAEWLARHPVHMLMKYKDDEVRTFDVVSSSGDQIQVWIDPPRPSGQVGVHVWDYHHRRSKDLNGDVAEVAKLVDEAYITAREWLGESSVG
jgi:hypothetical protein